jgi:hypothetical protein
MIFTQGKVCLGSCLFIYVFIIFSGFYTYYVNAKRAPDDPQKRDFSPYAPWIAPLTLPILALVNLLFFIVYSLLFGVFLVIFPFTLLLFRKPFLIKWILNLAQKIGNKLLLINTELLRATGFYIPIRQN